MNKVVLLFTLVILSLGSLFATTVLSEDFSLFTPVNTSTDISLTQAAMDAKFHTTGWTGSKIFVDTQYEAKLGSGSVAGYVVTKTVDLSANSGAATLQFDVRYYGTDTGKYVQVWFAPSGTTFSQVGSDIALASTMTAQTVNITGGTASSKIKIIAKLASNNRFYLDNFVLSQTASGPTIPTLTTTAISLITLISASSGGTITSDGGATITVSGICWNTAGTPSITDSHTSDGTTTGTFVSALTGLTASQTYHVRAWATNSAGTGYGDELTFSTGGTGPPAAPVATSASSVTSTSFVANWNAVTDATSYRLDVSTSNVFASFISGYNNLTVTGLYQTVSGLTPSTTYYYRVRAYNTNGTSANSGTITQATTADPYSGYYTPVNGLTGDALKTGLHTLIATNTYTSYDGSKAYMFQTLDNVSNVVRCVYTGQDYTVSSSYDGSSNPNTEHTFAQSWFGTTDASKKKADLHHLFPTNSTVNSSRGNLPFDVVTTVGTTFPSYNSYVSKRGTNSTGHTVFEPADQHKGDLARALLYFSVRYNMSLSIDGVDMLPTLITWNSADPVDTKESTRNANIYTFLGNRNPFVDHPEYVTSIWGGSTANTTIQFSPASAEVNEAAGTVTLTVSILNPSATTATTAQVQLTDGTASDVNSYTTHTITFPAGSSANQTVTVNITDDAVMEGDETLVFSLASISGGTSASAGNYGSYNLTILDNDIPTAVATAASGIGDNGFTANWNAASGITTYEFDLSTSSDFSSIVNGYLGYQVTGTSLAITGLTSGTNYYYRVRSFYNETPGANSGTITTATTGTSTPTVILSEGFETALTATPPTGWTVSSTGSYILANVSNSHGGTHYAGTNLTNGWIETPILLNPSQLTFWGRASGATSNFTITVQTSPDNSTWSPVTTFVANGTDTGTMTSTYIQKTVDLNLSGSYYLRWNMTARSGGSFYFDDVEVTSGSVTPTIPPAPVATAATNLTTTGFTANWNASTGATSYRLDVSLSNTFDTYVTGYSDLTVSGLTQAVTGLTASTTYYYRVRANNTAGTSGNSGTITAITTAAATSDLMISEYLEGTSNNKVIELYNPTALGIDLSGYSLKVASNGNAWGSAITMTGTLAANGLWVVSYTQSNATILALANQTSGSLSFNGNDAVGLYKGTTLIDIIGVQGVDPGNDHGWAVAGVTDATVNHTLIRKVAISQGDTNWTTSAGTDASSSEWILYPIDTITGLGFHNEPGVTLDAPVAITATTVSTTGFTANWNAVTSALSYSLDVSTSDTFTSFVTGYENLTVNGLTQVVSGVTNTTSYYYRVRAVNDALTSGNSNTITVVTGTPGTTDLLISEYLEGSNTNKAIEIYNPTSAGILLTGVYTLKQAPNGGAWGSAISLTGTLAANDVFVAANPAGDAPILAVTDLSTGALTFNGNDAVGLFKNGVLIDVVGLQGTNPVTGWQVDNVPTATANHTLIRKLTIIQGNTNWVTSADSVGVNSEWVVYPIDTYTGLGLHNMPLVPPTAPVATAATDVTTSGFTANWGAVATATSYRLDVSTVNTFLTYVTGYNDLTVNGLTQTVTGLAEGTTYYYQVRAFDGASTSANSNTITVLTGTTPVIPDIPVATDATGISTTGFTATWEVAANAASYRLDVSTSNVFASYLTGYEDLTVTGLSQAISGLNASTTYYYRVRGYSLAGTSGNSNVIIVQTNSISTTPDLFISEYIEGSGNNKAIEIYNPTAFAVDLSAYKLNLSNNGNPWNTTPISLTGTLAANDVYVVANSSAASTEIIAAKDLSSTVLTFNGNDAVGLYKNGTMIDVVGIGVLGTSVPTVAWDVAGTTLATKDHTMVRKSETIHGNLDWVASSGTTVGNSEWTVYPVDTFTYIGSHTGPSASLDTPVVTITTDGDNIFLAWNDINGALSYRVEAADSPDGTYTDVSLQGTFDDAAGISSWKLTLVDNLKFFRVYALSTAK